MSDSYAGYSVYYYDTSVSPAVGYGMAGRIEDDGSSVTPSPDMNTNLNGDPKVEGIRQNPINLDIVVTDYETGVTNRPVYVYDAVDGSLDTTIASGWSNVDNLYSLVKLGSYLYAIDYDNARVVEINAGTYAQTGTSYTLAGGFVPAGYTARGQALIVIGDTLFGLFTFVNSTWTAWESSLLVRFTVTGGSSITVGATDYNDGLAPNGFAMDVYGSDLYIATIGGVQGSSGTPNANSCIQKIAYGAATLNTATVSTLLTPSGDHNYEFRDISFNGSTAYVLMGTYHTDGSGDWVINGKLVSTDTTFATLTPIDTFTNVKAYFWAAQYTADNTRLWYVKGNQIIVYTAGSFGTPVATLTLSSGSLLSANEPHPYDNINDFAYVGKYGIFKAMRGYRSPLQASRSKRAVALRAITRGRPEATEDEIAQADAMVASGKV